MAASSRLQATPASAVLSDDVMEVDEAQAWLAARRQVATPEMPR